MMRGEVRYWFLFNCSFLYVVILFILFGFVYDCRGCGLVDFGLCFIVCFCPLL